MVSQLVSAARLADRDEDGFTLVELMVTMMIFVIVVALILPTYLIANQSSTNTTSMTTDDSAIVPALNQLASQLDNSSYLWLPSASLSYQNSGSSSYQTTTASGGPGGSAILLYYYYGGNLSALQGLCSQWRVYNGQLQDRTWSSTSPPPSLAFRPIASGLNITASSSGQPFFALEGPSGSGADIVDVDFMIRPTSSNSPSQEFQTSMAAQQLLMAKGLSLQSAPNCNPPVTP